MTDVATYHVTVDALDRKIHTLAKSINAQNYEMLTLIREFDERCGWVKWGSTSCAHWLHWRCDVSMTTAHEKVRMARALKDLPQIAGAFSTGELSYSKVRALTRVATALNEGPLLEYALSASAARVEERCRQLRQGSPESLKQARSVYAARGLRLSRPDERGMVTAVAEIPQELALLLTQALDKAIEQDVRDGPEFEDSSWSALQADALVVLAKHYLSGHRGGASTADQYQVVVHVDEAVLNRDDADGGRADLPLESVRRLSCDGALIPMTSTPAGEPLNVGRKRRTVPTALKRALWARDKGCAFPGCSHTRYVDAHHVRHWSQGGQTNIDNMLLVCSAHHRLVHEGGYTIEKDHQGKYYFKRPDGRAVPRLGYCQDDMVDESVEDDSSAEDKSLMVTNYATVPHQPTVTIRETSAYYSSGPPPGLGLNPSVKSPDSPSAYVSCHGRCRPTPAGQWSDSDRLLFRE